MNTEEFSIIMNVPRQEVQGITIREAAPIMKQYNMKRATLESLPSFRRTVQPILA